MDLFIGVLAGIGLGGVLVGFWDEDERALYVGAGALVAALLATVFYP